MIETISQLVAQTESNNKLYALRFEPAYHPLQANVLKCVAANKPMSYVTAEGICASSFGKYQIMLDNVYQLGYAGTALDFWANSDIQETYFKKFIIWKGIDYSLAEIISDKTKREHFAKRYNGSIAYADRLMMIFGNSK